MRSARWAIFVVMALLAFGCGGDDSGGGDEMDGVSGAGGGNPVCGNGVIEAGEECDPNAPLPTCAKLGFSSMLADGRVGMVTCSLGCTLQMLCGNPANALTAGNGGGGAGG